MMPHPNVEFDTEVAKAFDEKAAELGLDPDDEIPFDDDGDTGTDISAVDKTPGTALEDGKIPEQATDQPVVSDTELHIPPHTWPAEWKEVFNKLPPEGKSVALKMNSEMERGFQRKMGQLGKQARELEGIHRSVQPHLDRLARAGLAPETAIQRALAWDMHIQQHGAQGLADMAKAYGFDPATLQPQVEEYLTPTERQLKQELEAMQGKLQGFEQRSNQMTQEQEAAYWRQREDEAANTIEQFMTATDPSGKPLHPYIGHVHPTMARLINSKLADNLEDAYQMALTPKVLERFHPDVHAALTRQAVVDPEEVRKVNEVRRAASTGIVSKSPIVSGGKMTDEQAFSAEYSKKRRA